MPRFDWIVRNLLWKGAVRLVDEESGTFSDQGGNERAAKSKYWFTAFFPSYQKTAQNQERNPMALATTNYCKAALSKEH